MEIKIAKGKSLVIITRGKIIEMSEWNLYFLNCSYFFSFSSLLTSATQVRVSFTDRCIIEFKSRARIRFERAGRGGCILAWLRSFKDTWDRC